MTTTVIVIVVLCILVCVGVGLFEVMGELMQAAKSLGRWIRDRLS